MCSSGEATPKDRERMYGWNQPSQRERDRYRRQPGEPRRGQRPPGRGSVWRGLPNPGTDPKKDDRKKPWGWQFAPQLARLLLLRHVR